MPKPPLIQAVCQSIRNVPRGRVSTYGAIAKAAGYPRCARHVGRVLREVQGLPWQRILGSGGRISLRGEAAMEQRFLLESEGVRFRGRKVDMKQFEHRFASPARERSAATPKSASSRSSGRTPPTASRGRRGRVHTKL